MRGSSLEGARELNCSRGIKNYAPLKKTVYAPPPENCENLKITNSAGLTGAMPIST